MTRLWRRTTLAFLIHALTIGAFAIGLLIMQPFGSSAETSIRAAVLIGGILTTFIAGTSGERLFWRPMTLSLGAFMLVFDCVHTDAWYPLLAFTIFLILVFAVWGGEDGEEEGPFLWRLLFVLPLGIGAAAGGIHHFWHKKSFVRFGFWDYAAAFSITGSLFLGGVLLVFYGLGHLIPIFAVFSVASGFATAAAAVVHRTRLPNDGTG